MTSPPIRELPVQDPLDILIGSPALAASEPLTPKEIAEALDKHRGSVRRILREMLHAGEIQATGSRYTTLS